MIISCQLLINCSLTFMEFTTICLAGVALGVICLMIVSDSSMAYCKQTFTAFTLTRFGSDISLGTVRKCSVNRAKPCQTEPCWDYLTEPGQHGLVRFYCECKRCLNCANCFQSSQWTSRVG